MVTNVNNVSYHIVLLIVFVGQNSVSTALLRLFLVVSIRFLVTIMTVSWFSVQQLLLLSLKFYTDVL